MDSSKADSAASTHPTTSSPSKRRRPTSSRKPSNTYSKRGGSGSLYFGETDEGRESKRVLRDGSEMTDKGGSCQDSVGANSVRSKSSEAYTSSRSSRHQGKIKSESRSPNADLRSLGEDPLGLPEYKSEDNDSHYEGTGKEPALPSSFGGVKREEGQRAYNDLAEGEQHTLALARRTKPESNRYDYVGSEYGPFSETDVNSQLYGIAPAKLELEEDEKYTVSRSVEGEGSAGQGSSIAAEEPVQSPAVVGHFERRRDPPEVTRNGQKWRAVAYLTILPNAPPTFTRHTAFQTHSMQETLELLESLARREHVTGRVTGLVQLSDNEQNSEYLCTVWASRDSLYVAYTGRFLPYVVGTYVALLGAFPGEFSSRLTYLQQQQ